MKKAPIPREVKSSFSLIEKLQKDYVAQNAPVIEEIRKIIEQRKDILKRYGIDDAIENVQKIMRSHNELQQMFNSNQNTLVLPALHEPETSQSEILRSIVKEELQKALGGKSPQTDIHINSENIIAVENRSYELSDGSAEIIRILSEYNTFIETHSLVKLSETYNTDGSMRKALADTSKKLVRNLKLKDPFIISKRGKGYMINSIYSISFTK